MPQLTIQVDNHDQPYTVSEMRRRLAQVLSKLNGTEQVSFSFHASFETYTPAPLPGAVMGELAAPQND